MAGKQIKIALLASLSLLPAVCYAQYPKPIAGLQSGVDSTGATYRRYYEDFSDIGRGEKLLPISNQGYYYSIVAANNLVVIGANVKEGAVMPIYGPHVTDKIHTEMSPGPEIKRNSFECTMKRQKGSHSYGITFTVSLKSGSENQYALLIHNNGTFTLYAATGYSMSGPFGLGYGIFSRHFQEILSRQDIPGFQSEDFNSVGFVNTAEELDVLVNGTKVAAIPSPPGQRSNMVGFVTNGKVSFQVGHFDWIVNCAN